MEAYLLRRKVLAHHNIGLRYAYAARQIFRPPGLMWSGGGGLGSPFAANVPTLLPDCVGAGDDGMPDSFQIF